MHKDTGGHIDILFMREDLAFGEGPEAWGCRSMGEVLTRQVCGAEMEPQSPGKTVAPVCTPGAHPMRPEARLRRREAEHQDGQQLVGEPAWRTQWEQETPSQTV